MLQQGEEIGLTEGAKNQTKNHDCNNLFTFFGGKLKTARAVDTCQIKRNLQQTIRTGD
jgi:hypothetical protein